MPQETWYILEDGTYADPREVSVNEAGVLQHKGGVAVAKRAPDVYSSVGVDPEVERAKKPKAKILEAKDIEEPQKTTRDMRPHEPYRRQSYNTR
jgi:hypothetical protein